MKFEELNFRGIYTLKFASTKIYVGQAINVYKRYKQHCNLFLNGKHSIKMQREYDIVRILPTVTMCEIVESGSLSPVEQKWINEVVRYYGKDKLLNTASIPGHIYSTEVQELMDRVSILEERVQDIKTIMELIP